MWVHLFQRAQLFWTLGRSMTKGFFLSSKSQEHFDKWFPEVLVFSCSQTIIFPLKNESRQNCYLRTTMLMPLSFDWTETHELTIFCVNAKQKHQKVVPYVSLNRWETFSNNRCKTEFCCIAFILMLGYTENDYRQTTDKLMFKSVISTVRWIRKLDIIKCAINKQNMFEE